MDDIKTTEQNNKNRWQGTTISDTEAVMSAFTYCLDWKRTLTLRLIFSNFSKNTSRPLLESKSLVGYGMSCFSR